MFNLSDRLAYIRSNDIVIASFLMLTGSLAGILGVIFASGFLEAFLQSYIPEKWLNTVSARGVQFGFGLFSASYFYYVNGKEAFCFKKLRSWIRSSLNKRDFLWVIAGFLMMGVVGVVFQEISSLLNLPHGSAGHEIENQLEASLSLAGVSSFLIAFIVPAFVEESFYRGVVQEKLSENYGALVTVLTSAFLFGLSHMIFSIISGSSVAVGFTGLLSTGIGGLFGFVIPYYKTKNLLVVALIHALGWTAFEPVQILISTL
jgi:membrane protease YdiL (CAAX protease family)